MKSFHRGYRYGSAAQYGPEQIIREKVIFVPIQYRLGTLGILGDGSKEFGGNVALFDMNAALQWVSEYISFFGGDKKRIKVMGHGSGASSAMMLSSSPMGRSSVNGVIAMSGSSLDHHSYDVDAKNTTKEIAIAHNCPHNDEVELVKCLQSKSVDEIIEKDSDLQIERLQEHNMIKAMSGMASFSPNIETANDNRGLPGMIVENPEDSLKKEPEKKIPLLIGTVKHETANAIDQKEIVKNFKSTSEFLKTSAETLKHNQLLNATKQASDKLMTTLSEYDCMQTLQCKL
jgi:carboxylesterase type B